MRRRGLIIGIGCVVGALTVGGCATPGYSRGRIESELVKAGTTPEQAQCVIAGMDATFDTRQLGSHSAPSLLKDKSQNKNEYELTRDVLHDCKITLPLNPLPH